MNDYDVCIIGAGASGLSAAIEASKRGLRTVIIDKNKKCGTKLYATGNGRCNIANAVFNADSYFFDDFALSVMNENSYIEVVSFLEELGIYTTENNGYIYPASKQSSTVVWALKDAAVRYGAEFIYNFTVKDIDNGTSIYKVKMISKSGELRTISATSVILAMGGISCRELGSSSEQEFNALMKALKLEYNPFLPGLVGAYVKEDISCMEGVRARGTISYFCSDNEESIIRSESGEIQFTKNTVSGIAMFNMLTEIELYLRDKDSSLEKEAFTITVDLMPEISMESLEEISSQLVVDIPNRTISALLNGFLHEKAAAYLINCHKLNNKIKVSECNETVIYELLKHAKELTFTLIAPGPLEKAQVSIGGIDKSFVDSTDFSIKGRNGLYACGEAIDVVGRCGGYNLMWAVTTGRIAGMNC